MEPKDFSIDLIDRARSGESQAFDKLFLMYCPKLKKLLYHFFKHEGDVEDVLQEVFLKAFLHIKLFRGESLFYTWLYRIAINTAGRYLQIRQKEQSYIVSVDDADTMIDFFLSNVDTPESIFYAQQLFESIYTIMDALPLELKEAFSLREFDGLTYQQISRVMSCPIGTVRSRIFRARSFLSGHLSVAMGYQSESARHVWLRI